MVKLLENTFRMVNIGLAQVYRVFFEVLYFPVGQA